MEDAIQSASEGRREGIRTTLQTRRISEPLRSKIQRERVTSPANPPKVYEVIIEVNLEHPLGRTASRDAVKGMLQEILGPQAETALARNRPGTTYPYVFASVSADQLLTLMQQDEEQDKSATDQALPATQRRGLRFIFRVWESQKVRSLTTESIRTVKANAAHNSFGALGEGVVWAVMDSGVDASHPHFALRQNLILTGSLAGKSCSFTSSPVWDQDLYGHGTHVAGIIAGEADAASKPVAAIQGEAANGDSTFHLQPVDGIRGMAPMAKLLILRVLDDNGDGDETALIQAIEYVQQLNDYGRHLVVHGVNISAGFPAHPTWYACGQTPLCVEINRLVKSGVVVVVAAGNSGHVVTFIDPVSTTEAGQLLSINDPGNAALAITVGSTHRQSPHTYGVSYFSSKGPTSDGRRKPEVVAPGEKVISAASSQRAALSKLDGLNGASFGYLEDTGTSMAAPHVSGVLAAFLSVKREYIGQPEATRDLLVQSAMDLGRDSAFQGAGLVDLMKLIQSV